MKKLMIAFAALCLAWSAAADPMKSEGVGTVSFRFVCQTDAMLVIADAATKSDEEAGEKLDAFMQIGFCRLLPEIATAPVLRVVAGPFTDFEGDKFYVVEVSPVLSIPAWPGINYRPAGFRI